MLEAANRVGTESVFPSPENNQQKSSLCFYGSSFITDASGEVVASADRTSECVISAELDFAAADELRMSWGLFRDRRPECYRIMTK